MHIADYLSATRLLGTDDGESTSDPANSDPAFLVGWCLPAIVSMLFFSFTFTRFFDWRAYKTFVPIVMVSCMLFHVLPIFASLLAGRDDQHDSGCEGESEQQHAQLAAEQGAWYVSKAAFYTLNVSFYSTYLPITLLLFCVLNGLYFAKTAIWWERAYCTQARYRVQHTGHCATHSGVHYIVRCALQSAIHRASCVSQCIAYTNDIIALPTRMTSHTQLGGLAPNLLLSAAVALLLLIVTDHARRRQFVLNALLRRSTDARLERLAYEQGVEKRKDRELLMAMTFHEVRRYMTVT